MTSKEQKKQQYYGALIIDSGAIIKQGNLANLIKSAEKCYTTAAVMSEIRDAKSREALASTLRTSLNDIIIEKPSNESIRAVTSFAKKTGDYRCLSAADMEVMALQYEMDVRLCGGSAEHLRSEPKGKLGVKVKPLNKNAPKAEQKAADAIGDGVILEEDCADDSNYDDESAIDDEATASDNEEEKEVDVDSSIVAQQAVPSPKAQAQPKSWAALVNPNAAVSTEVKVVDEDPVVKNALSVPLGKMNIASIGASSSSLGGQFDDAEESCNDEARLVSDDGNDNAANELDSEFPSLAAAAAVPYDGSDAEQEDADQPMLPVAEMERRKKESLKPKLTKDGRHYNSFQKYKHLVTSGGIGKHIKDEEELQREKELRRVEFAQGLQAMNTHELDELDPEWKNKSRVMGGSELVGQSDEVDDDGEGWVSVDNFRSGGASMFGLSKNKKKDKEETQADGGSADICRAACATTDFAMQNVILQMVRHHSLRLLRRTVEPILFYILHLKNSNIANGYVLFFVSVCSGHEVSNR